MKLIRSLAATAITLLTLAVLVPSVLGADVTPPQLQAAWVGSTLTNIYLQFSESMDPSTTQDPLHYTVSGGVTVQSVTLDANGFNLTLLTTPMTAGAAYTISVAGVLDRAQPIGNPISPNPTVLPVQLDYRTLGYLYLSPSPRAEYVSAQTRFVLVRFKDVSPNAVTNLSTFITVAGSKSGIHNGQTHVAMDGRTVIFQMKEDFSVNEVVRVTLTPLVGSGSSPDIYQYQFVIGRHLPNVGMTTARGENRSSQGKENAAMHIVSPKGTGSSPKFAIMPNGVSVPSDFPKVTITARGNPAPDYIWLDNVGQNGQVYKMILDTWGNPVFYQRGGTWDFKLQKNGVITWAGFFGVDKNFNYVGSYFAVNGYSTDGHELQILADGTYFLIGDGYESIDMSRFVTNGYPAAIVGENVVQQFTPAGELIFQWRAWDHMDILSQQPFTDLTATVFDFPHMNSIDVDEDGHILLSSRSNSECTKINRDTGEVIWRLGGSQSTLTFVNDPLNGPRNQHTFRAVGRGHYILFDNGDLHSPPVSRAVEYTVDPVAKTATLVWQFRDTPDKYAYYEGNVQRLANGNTHINWVREAYPKACEVDSNGVKQLEFSLTPGYELYRSSRSPWDGVVSVPYLIVEPYPDNVTLIFNKFGDTNVGSYRIYGGKSPHPTTLLATTPLTLAYLSNLENHQQYYFRVTAVAKDGTESGYSNEESVMVNFAQPGQNMLQNGDFSAGTNAWTFATANTGAGTFSVVTGACLLHITSAGTALTDLQLRQSGLRLIQGNQYVLEFDGSSVGGTHAIDVKLGQAQSPYGIFYTASPTLRTTPQHFTYTFTMTGATDLNTRLMFNLGALARDIVLDNISLYLNYHSEVTATIDTLPGGLAINVDGTNCTAPAEFTWATNSSHTLAAPTVQLSPDGHARYPFLSWSDGGAQTHTVTTPRLDTNYTASFSTEFLLDLAVAPAEGGRVTPLPAGPWHPYNQLVSLTANPSPGFSFLWWTGVDTQSNDTAQVTMTGYRNVTAAFQAAGSVIIDARSVVRLPDGSVRFEARAPGAATATLLGSTNLLTWQELQTVPVTNGTAVFNDSTASNFPRRFYHARLP